MSTMLDQLRELERLLVELGAKMGCPFEESQNCFRPVRGFLESPESICDSRETLNCDSGPKWAPPYEEEDRHGNIEDLRRSKMEEPSELNFEASSEFQEDGWAQQAIEVLEATADKVCPVLYESSMEVLGLSQTEENQGTNVFKPSTVILEPIIVVHEIEYEEMRELVEESMALIEIKWNDIRINSLVVDMPSAYKVFDILPRREIVLRNVVVVGKNSVGTNINLLAVVLPFDRDGIVIFDPGGFLAFLASGPTLRSSGVETVIGNAIVDRKLLELI